jgi:hypothetical protein
MSQICWYAFLKALSHWKFIIYIWNLAEMISTLMSNGTEIKLNVASYVHISWKWEMNFCCRSWFFSLHFLDACSELENLLHYFIAAACPTVETSSQMLPFGQSFYCHGDSLLVAWFSVHLCFDGCQRKLQSCTQSFNFHIFVDISVLRFHITQEIFKLSMILSFDLMKMMCLEPL